MDVMRLTGRFGARAGARAGTAQDLLSQARDGDSEAFRLIFERYSRPIISFIYDMVGGRELAEELAQETFVRAHRNLHTIRDETKLSTWLFGIAKNVARESLRSRRRDVARVDIDEDRVLELSDGSPLPDRQLLNKELNGVVEEALSALDEDKRLVFALKILQQRSYEEIAVITGSSIPKLKTDLHRAKAEMRRRIRPYLGVSE
jgi:RNA polymerase sigma-70 factor (ECF subfamily)